jgi:hypothetical protein
VRKPAASPWGWGTLSPGLPGQAHPLTTTPRSENGGAEALWRAVPVDLLSLMCSCLTHHCCDVAREWISKPASSGPPSSGKSANTRAAMSSHVTSCSVDLSRTHRLTHWAIPAGHLQSAKILSEFSSCCSQGGHRPPEPFCWGLPQWGNRVFVSLSGY